MAFAVKTTVSHHVSTATNVTPSLFAPSKASYAHTCLSIPFKPLSFNLSCSYSSSLSLPNFLSLKRKEPISPVSVISAQQEENFPLAVEEQGQESEGSLNWGASQSDAELNEEAKVYVGNLPYDVDHVQLAAIFEDAGIVEEARVITHRESDESRGFGFVTMNTVEEAEKAVEMFNQYDIGGRLLTVNKASPKGSRPERPPRVFEASSTRLYVGNLPWTKTDDGLKQIFTPFGKVVSARVVTDRETGRSRGFGFVEMSSDSEAQDAISNLDGELVEGRGIRVNIASADRRRSSY